MSRVADKDLRCDSLTRALACPGFMVHTCMELEYKLMYLTFIIHYDNLI